MVTYSLACQSVAKSTSASSDYLVQHGGLLLIEFKSIIGPPGALQKPNSRLGAVEQQSGLYERNQKNGLYEHVTGGEEERSNGGVFAKVGNELYEAEERGARTRDGPCTTRIVVMNGWELGGHLISRMHDRILKIV